MLYINLKKLNSYIQPRSTVYLSVTKQEILKFQLYILISYAAFILLG